MQKFSIERPEILLRNPGQLTWLSEEIYRVATDKKAIFIGSQEKYQHEVPTATGAWSYLPAVFELLYDIDIYSQKRYKKLANKNIPRSTLELDLDEAQQMFPKKETTGYVYFVSPKNFTMTDPQGIWETRFRVVPIVDTFKITYVPSKTDEM